MAQFLNVKGIENGTITCTKLDSTFLCSLYSSSCFTNDLCNINTDVVDEGVSNLYFTNTRADARVLCATGANLDLSCKTTDELAEGSCNFYYTDSKARLSLCGTGDITYCNTTGEISVTTYKSCDFDVNFAGKFTCDLAECSDLFYTDARARLSLCGGGDITYCDTTGEISVTTYKTCDFNIDFAGKFTCDVAECGNLYYTDARADARIDLCTGSNLDLSLKTTDDLPQGTCNFYSTGPSVSEDDALALAIALG